MGTRTNVQSLKLHYNSLIPDPTFRIEQFHRPFYTSQYTTSQYTTSQYTTSQYTTSQYSTQVSPPYKPNLHNSAKIRPYTKTMSLHYQQTNEPSKKRTALLDDLSAQSTSKRRCVGSSTKAPCTTWRHLPTEIQQDIIDCVLHDRLVDAVTTSEKPAADEGEHGRTYMPSFRTPLRSLMLLELDAEKPGLLISPLPRLRQKVVAAQDDLENRVAPTVHTGKRLADMQALHIHEELSMAFAMDRRPLEFQNANVERIMHIIEDPTAGETTCDNQFECVASIRWISKQRSRGQPW